MSRIIRQTTSELFINPFFKTCSAYLKSRACGEMRNTNKILVGKPKGKTPFWRSKIRWKDHTKAKLKILGCEVSDWIRMVQVRVQWKGERNEYDKLKDMNERDKSKKEINKHGPWVFAVSKEWASEDLIPIQSRLTKLHSIPGCEVSNLNKIKHI